ncbi:hypothetical protein BIY29_05390 [Brenneria alni]|uniref:Uncharacterized protein n=1 Tax=Brenneria alni TaxID=71656 RepID=A0A421DR93_9GAMM|nr:hypothetical protein [Brenneria alni]RLM26493.1 hypothetical protein BIY29_05390 [Brenneria alni]
MANNYGLIDVLKKKSTNKQVKGTEITGLDKDLARGDIEETLTAMGMDEFSKRLGLALVKKGHVQAK